MLIWHTRGLPRPAPFPIQSTACAGCGTEPPRATPRFGPGPVARERRGPYPVPLLPASAAGRLARRGRRLLAGGGTGTDPGWSFRSDAALHERKGAVHVRRSRPESRGADVAWLPPTWKLRAYCGAGEFMICAPETLTACPFHGSPTHCSSRLRRFDHSRRPGPSPNRTDNYVMSADLSTRQAHFSAEEATRISEKLFGGHELGEQLLTPYDGR